MEEDFYKKLRGLKEGQIVTQREVEKSSQSLLSTKTKIVAWWMIVIGAIGIFYSSSIIIESPSGDFLIFIPISVVLLIFSILLVHWGRHLLNKEGRTKSVILLFLITIFWCFVLVSLSGYTGVNSFCSDRCRYDIRSLGDGAITYKMDRRCMSICGPLSGLLFSTPFLVPLFLLLIDKRNW